MQRISLILIGALLGWLFFSQSSAIAATRSSLSISFHLSSTAADTVAKARGVDRRAISQRPNAETPKAPTVDESIAEGLRNERVSLPGKLDADLSRLIRAWNNGYVSRLENRKAGPPCQDLATLDGRPLTPDSVYIRRLAKLPSVVPMTFNPVVKDCINLYVERRRPLLRSMLTLGDLYFPMIEQTLDKYGLPDELKYLSIVESALNPTAVSPAGASGLWQFMLPTGKIYGLTVNSLVDDRLDPEKSTDAACRYLKDMYRIYKDWLLVIASYNCGPGNVNRAIRSAGGTADFWKIYLYLPRETRSYIPLFMAAFYSMTYYREHNICPRQMVVPLASDTIMISKPVSFDRIAQITGVDKGVIGLLNPQYKRDIVPGNIRPYPLKLPLVSLHGAIQRRDSLYSSDLSMKLVSPASLSTSESGVGASKYHTVGRGDTLAKIAKQYGTNVAALRKMNGKRVNKIKPGMRIKVRR